MGCWKNTRRIHKSQATVNQQAIYKFFSCSPNIQHEISMSLLAQ